MLHQLQKQDGRDIVTLLSHEFPGLTDKKCPSPQVGEETIEQRKILSSPEEQIHAFIWITYRRKGDLGQLYYRIFQSIF